MPIKMKLILQRGLLMLLCIYLPGNALFAAEGFKKVRENQISQFVVRGNVVSESDGLPLPGVTVLVQGTSSGVVTDFDGNYEIEISNPDEAVIEFSYVGFKSQEIPVNSRSTINISLVEDLAELDEVVVIGYQTIQREDLTGAVSVIKPEAMRKVTAVSLAESIQGLSPGVTVRNSGGPGDGASINIRGVASFTNTNPLYIIDGMIADANPTINTNDIASIQILKDASAAAIYGSRAANGVIIITTKEGRTGPAQLSVSAKYGVSEIYKLYDVMNSTEFAAMQTIQYENSGVTPPASVGANFDPSIDTDWQKEAFRMGNMQDYNVSLSGGSETSKYFVSGSYYGNKGVSIGQSFDRMSLRINTESELGRVTFGENLVLTSSTDESPGIGNPFYDAPQMLPVIPVRSDDYITETNPMGWGIGSTQATTYAWNPVAVNYINSSEANYAKLVGNAFINVEIADWLDYRFNAGTEVSFDFAKNVTRDGVYRFNAPDYPTSVNENRSRFSSLLLEHTLNFDKSFGDHSLNGVLGYTQQHTTRSFTSAGRSDLQVYDQYFTTIGSATGEAVADGGTPVDYRIYGYLGRVNYNYGNRYLLTLTGRVDQDSRFGENYDTGFFPSVAAAWKISEESFFDVDWIADLKLKASYGELGIVPLNSWDYTSFINTNPRAVFGDAQEVYVGKTQAQLANPDLKWEERIVKNIGIEAGLWNNQLTLSAAVYNSLSKDNLLQLPVAGYLGNLQGNPFVNAGSIRNTGLEFDLTYRDYESSDFTWDVSVNFTTINNTVEDVGNRGAGINYIQIGNTRTEVGRSIGEWFLLETDGIFQSMEEVQDHTNEEGDVIQPFSQPGDIRYVDHDGDGDIDSEDRVYSGSPWPSLQLGAQTNLNYRNFDLSLQFVGVFGTQVYNDVRRILDGYQNTNFRSDIRPWTPENTNTDDPRIGLASDQGIDFNNRGDSDRWLENGSYLRLRNLELGYNLSEDFLENIGMDFGRIYLSGQNLLTITEYSGLDPDVVGSGIYERGLDSGNWPSSRIYSVGVQLDF